MVEAILVYRVNSVEEQDDWRFFDIQADVFEIDKESECCSVCSLHGKEPVRKVKIILPYTVIRMLESHG